MQKRLECIIRGRVQFVMFRDFTLRHAMKRNIKGTVQNKRDGSVRVVAEGAEENLHDFLTALRKGPFFAHVEKVEEKWQEATGEYTSFHILYD